MKKRLFMMLLPMITLSAWASPGLLTYEGVLQDGRGVNLQGFHDLEFRFFETPESGKPLSVVTFEALEIESGRVALNFADGVLRRGLSADDAVARFPELFLSIVVDGALDTPPMRVASYGGTIVFLAGDSDRPAQVEALLPASVPVMVGKPFVGVGSDRLSGLPSEGLAGPVAADDPKAFEAVDLAEFSLPNGNTVKFVAMPELGDVGIFETAPIGGEGPVIAATYEGMNAVEIFQAIAPEGTPLPALLAESKAARNELRVEELDRVGESGGDLGAPALSSGQGDPLKAHCAAGGAQFFLSNHCNLTGNNPIPWCDHHVHWRGGDSLWGGLQRISNRNGWQRRFNSFARTGACSNDVIVTDHFWGCPFFFCRWQVTYIETVPAGSIFDTIWFGASRRYRFTHRLIQGNTGGFRAFTLYYDN